MNTIRAFIAVEIDQSNKQKLSLLISRLKNSNAHIKWATEKQMHLTLKFLGNIEQNKLEEISAVLESIAGNFSAFTIQFSKLGAFPDLRRPRVIWLGIDKGSESLKLLNSKLETELEKLGFDPSTWFDYAHHKSPGIRREKREYKVHLTLGRVKSLKNIPDLVKLIDTTSLELQDEIKIDRLILFQSTLTPKGAIYTPMAQHFFRVQ